MTKKTVYLLFLHPGDDPEEDGALIKREGVDYYRCSKRYAWVEDRDMCKYFCYDPDDTECISTEKAEALLRKWEPGWKTLKPEPPLPCYLLTREDPAPPPSPGPWRFD